MRYYSEKKFHRPAATQAKVTLEVVSGRQMQAQLVALDTKASLCQQLIYDCLLQDRGALTR